MSVIGIDKKEDRKYTFLADKISEEIEIEFERLRFYTKYDAGTGTGDSREDYCSS